MSELGLDEQKSDIRPASKGNAAMDAEARSSHAFDAGKSGEAQGDHTRLNLGGLSICPTIGTRRATAGDGLRDVSRGHSSRRASFETSFACDRTYSPTKGRTFCCKEQFRNVAQLSKLIADQGRCFSSEDDC